VRSRDAVGKVPPIGMVRGTEDFGQHTGVVDGASQLLRETLGDRGVHTRSAVGMNSLPFGIPVEIKKSVQVATPRAVALGEQLQDSSAGEVPGSPPLRWPSIPANLLKWVSAQWHADRMLSTLKRRWDWKGSPLWVIFVDLAAMRSSCG